MPSIVNSSATKLHCRHCGGEIESNSRRPQCPHCGALFPFACLVCARSLRAPFPVFDDERYITFEKVDEQSGARTEAKPLCPDHFLRHCPDCSRWFHAQENPGFFRCASCAAAKEQQSALLEPVEEPIVQDDTEFMPSEAEILQEQRLVPDRHLDPNLIALAIGGGALVGLICWYVLNL